MRFLSFVAVGRSNPRQLAMDWARIDSARQIGPATGCGT